MAPKKREVIKSSEERTSAKVASAAAKILNSKTASKEAKAVAASALTQRSPTDSAQWIAAALDDKELAGRLLDHADQLVFASGLKFAPAFMREAARRLLLPKR